MVVTKLLTKIIGFIFNDSEEDLVGPFLNRGDSISHITVWVLYSEYLLLRRSVCMP